MQANLKLSFTPELELEVLWVETGQRSIVPPEFWPQSPEELRALAIALFPRYQMRLRGARGKERRRLKARERYYKKLVPQQEEFEVQSKSGKTYKITVIDRGKGRNFHCNCPDYVFRKRRSGTYCKHIVEWLKEKKHPAAEEIAVVDKRPTFQRPPELWKYINGTLRTGDIDMEEEFEATIRRKTRQLELKQKLHARKDLAG